MYSLLNFALILWAIIALAAGKFIHEWKDRKSKDKEPLQISLLQDEKGYKIFINIVKRVRCQDYDVVMAQNFNDTGDIELFKANHIGPDEIIVQLEGATMQAKVARSTNYCNNYEAYFQVPVSGRHFLKVIRLRQDFAAIKYTHDFQSMNYEVLLETSIDSLDTYIPVPCKTTTAPQDVGYWVSSDPQILPLRERIVINNQCKKENEKRGLKMRTNLIIHRDVLTEKCARDIEFYNWSRKMCTDNFNYESKDKFGIPVNLRRTELPPIDFSGKSILFVGDSHMRGLVKSFLYDACEYDEQGQLEKEVKSKTPLGHTGHQVAYAQFDMDPKENAEYRNRHKSSRVCDKDGQCTMCSDNPDQRGCKLFHPRCNNMKLMYLNAMYCEVDVVDLFYKYDYVIVNCGHHPASSSHYTFYKFTSVVNSFFERIQEFTSKSRKTKKIIWIENVAIPLHQDQGVIMNRDWRTYHRLLLFAVIAQNAIIKTKVPVPIVPAFHLTLAAFDKYCDCTHYPSAAREPILLSLLDKLSSKESNFLF